MNTLFIICISLGCLSVIAVMGLGIFSMAKGGEFNKKYGNKLMQARVILQGAVLLLLALAIFSSKS